MAAFPTVGTMTIVNCTVYGNGLSQNNLQGGGIYNSGNLTVQDSTIDGNSAYMAGGGIYNFNNLGTATVTLSNTIVANNYDTSSPISPAQSPPTTA